MSSRRKMSLLCQYVIYCLWIFAKTSCLAFTSFPKLHGSLQVFAKISCSVNFICWYVNLQNFMFGLLFFAKFLSKLFSIFASFSCVFGKSVSRLHILPVNLSSNFHVFHLWFVKFCYSFICGLYIFAKISFMVFKSLTKFCVWFVIFPQFYVLLDNLCQNLFLICKSSPSSCLFDSTVQKIHVVFVKKIN